MTILVAPELSANHLTFVMSQQFVIIAHRGDSSAAPENTVEAFDLALAQGFQHFETDCQLSADGIPVVLHDESLGRVNNGAGPAAAATLEQLQQLDAGSWFALQFAGARIPTLEHVLTRYRGRAHIHLELKSQQPDLPAAVATLVHKLQWLPDKFQDSIAGHATTAAAAAATLSAVGGSADGRFVGQVPGLTMTSFHLGQLQASKQLLPEVPHAWLIQEVTPDVISTAQQSHFEMVCPRANALTAEGVQLLKQAGFAVRAWGVKNIELLHHVVACGVDGATVNWPKEAAEALGMHVGTKLKSVPSSWFWLNSTSAAAAAKHRAPAAAQSEAAAAAKQQLTE